MALNKNDRSQIEKKAENEGYKWNSNASQMINGNGGSMKFSPTSGSVTINNTHYSSASDAKKSSKW